MPNEVFIGVDVCKPRLDLMILPTGEILEFENSTKGIKQFVKRPKLEGAALGSRSKWMIWMGRFSSWSVPILS
jgi:hypothetical protein